MTAENVARTSAVHLTAYLRWKTRPKAADKNPLESRAALAATKAPETGLGTDATPQVFAQTVFERLVAGQNATVPCDIGGSEGQHFQKGSVKGRQYIALRRRPEVIPPVSRQPMADLHQTTLSTKSSLLTPLEILVRRP